MKSMKSMTYNIKDYLGDADSCTISVTELSNRLEAHMFVRFKLAKCHRK